MLFIIAVVGGSWWLGGPIGALIGVVIVLLTVLINYLIHRPSPWP